MKHRVFNIMQYEFNPVSGEDLHFNENNIIFCIGHKTIKRWAYVCHDKDIVTEEDATKNDYLEQGKKKPRHWHGVFQTDKAVEIETIAKWLGIQPQYIDIPKGQGSFLDCVEYLTHENPKQQAKGKYHYSDDEIKSNFDFREELNKRTEKKLKYGRDLSEQEQMMYDVLYNGKTLAECRKDNDLLYLKNCNMLEKLRQRYLVEVAKVPGLRINFYIDGKGGIGKNTASKILAKLLFPNVENPYFELGGKGVSFQAYDGQPCIIWNDKRARDFIMEFGRGETFDILDMHPTDSTHNIKYGSTRLINSINIINGIESYNDFINGLSGEYTDRNGTFYKSEDKSQARRRIPIILCLREEEFDCLLNKGVAEGTREFEQYIYYECIKGSFAKLAQKLEGQAQVVVGSKMLEPALESVDQIKSRESNKISDVNNIPEEFKNYGTHNGMTELPF